MVLYTTTKGVIEFKLAISSYQFSKKVIPKEKCPDWPEENYSQAITMRYRYFFTQFGNSPSDQLYHKELYKSYD
jgi:hypothetical protein